MIPLTSPRAHKCISKPKFQISLDSSIIIIALPKLPKASLINIKCVIRNKSYNIPPAPNFEVNRRTTTQNIPPHLLASSLFLLHKL